MKRCSCCNRILPLEAFCRNRSRPDGLAFYCRQCNSKASMASKKKHYKTSEITRKIWCKKNRARTAAIAKKWRIRNPEKFKASRDRNNVRQRATNPHVSIPKMVYRAIKLEKLKREPCVICKKFYLIEKEAVAHHNDYNKPLDVTWLCRQHHAAWHRVFIPEKKNELVNTKNIKAA